MLSKPERYAHRIAINLNSLRTTLTLTLGYNTGTAFTQPRHPSDVIFVEHLRSPAERRLRCDDQRPSLLLDGVTQVMATGAVPPSSQLTIRTAIDHQTPPVREVSRSRRRDGNTSSGSPTIRICLVSPALCRPACT